MTLWSLRQHYLYRRDYYYYYYCCCYLRPLAVASRSAALIEMPWVLTMATTGCPTGTGASAPTHMTDIWPAGLMTRTIIGDPTAATANHCSRPPHQHSFHCRSTDIEGERVKNFLLNNQWTATAAASTTTTTTTTLLFSARFLIWSWISQYQNVSIFDFIGAKDYLLTYLLTYLLVTYLLTYLLTYLPTYLLPVIK